MKITICSSAFFVEKAYKIKEKLEEKGHEILIYPKEIEIDGNIIGVGEYYKDRKDDLTEKLLEKKKELLNNHLKKIEKSDGILILNFDKDGKRNYIGGNTFLEMGIAHYLGKKIFVYKELPENSPFFEEIAAFDTIIIKENLENIK